MSRIDDDALATSGPPSGSGPPSSRSLPVLMPVNRTAVVNANPAAPMASAAPTITTLLRAFTQRWLLAVAVGLTLAGIVTIPVWHLVSPQRYVARTLLHIESKPYVIAYSVETNRPDPAGYRQTQKALAKSRLVLGNALNQPQVAQLTMIKDAIANQLEPVEWLDREIRADFSVGTELLSISMSGDNPDELKVLIDAVRNAYLQKIVHKERADRAEQLAKLDDLYNNYQSIVRRKEQELRKLAKTIGSSDLPSVAIKQQFAAESLGTAQRELGKLQGEMRSLQIKINDMQAAGKADDTVPEKTIVEALARDPALASYSQEVKSREEELERAKAVAIGNALKAYEARLDVARNKLNVARAERRPTLLAILQEEQRLKNTYTLANYESQLDFMKKLAESVRAEISQLEAQFEAMTAGSLDVEFLRRDVAQVEAVAKKLSEQKEALRVELDAPARVQVLEEAVVSRTHNERKQILATLGAGLVSFVVGALGIAWLEYSARRVNTPDDVVSSLGLPLVGTIPQWSLGQGHWPVQLSAIPTERPTSATLLVESADAMRAMLLQQRDGAPRVLMVTSAQRGEGKTALASNLAASIARARNRTLLIDADLRRPAIHRVFALPVAPGLQDLLRAEAPASEVIQATALPNLHVITAGRLAGHPAQVLTPAALPQLLRELREQFDYIVVDTCPVLPVADALLVGQYVDGVIFALMRGTSRLPRVHAAYQKMANMGLPILGGVLNAARNEVGGYDMQYVPKSHDEFGFSTDSLADIDISVLEKRQ